MKRFILVVLTICMMASLVGCSGGKKAKELSRGSVDGDVYTNDFAGLTFTKPESWIYATDEEIAAVMDIGAEVLQQGDYVKQVADLTTIYDMMASDLRTGNNINVVFENLQASASTSITEKQYIETFMEMITEQASMMGYTFSDPTTVKLGNETYTKVAASGSYLGISFSQSLYVHKVGNYMIAITISIFDGTPDTTFEAMFS